MHQVNPRFSFWEGSWPCSFVRSCCRDGMGVAPSTRLHPGMGGVLTHVRQMATAIASTPSLWGLPRATAVSRSLMSRVQQKWWSHLTVILTAMNQSELW